MTSINAEKLFNKTQHTFLTKKQQQQQQRNLSKLAIEGDILNLIEGIYEKPSVNITPIFP